MLAKVETSDANSDVDVKVRLAVPEDIDHIMDLARLVWHENGLAKNLDETAVRNAVIWAVHCGNGVCGVIGQIGKPLEGVVLLQVTKWWYSGEVHLEELCVFTHPDFRSAKGGRAKKLVQFSKYVSDRLGMPLTIGILSNKQTEAKIRLYRRELGEPAGAFFTYGAKTGQES